MGSFLDCFGGLSDPRADNARHDLLEVVFVALAAVLCGAEDCTDMVAFARSKLLFLRQVVKLEHGPPSHDTFSRVFRRLDPEPFEAAFARFTAAFAGALQGVVAIDGKALLGAYERGRKSAPLHLVNVWAAQTRLVIGQRLAPGRNEVLGARQALALMDGCIVTADALHCRADTAQRILDASGDYALALKANHPILLRQAQAGQAEPVIVRYFLLSKLMSAQQVLDVARTHWTIENQVHWVLDVALGEDACRSRKNNAPQNLALLRKLALNILRSHPDKGSIKTKLKRAGWDDAFLTAAIAHMR